MSSSEKITEFQDSGQTCEEANDIGVVGDSIPEDFLAHPEANQPSDEIAVDSLVRRATETYFRPKSFESTELYEKLGIKTFKKYLPTSGDLVNKYIWHGSISPLPKSGSRRERVQKMESVTRVYEGIHLGMFAVYQALAMKADAYSEPRIATIAAGLQLGVNVYPIMLQRYNRLRAYHILDRQK